MTLAAPQLYGSTAQRAGGSDSSASYTREQMEKEVKRQVEQAMQGHRALSDENQRLRLELEAMRAQTREVLAESRRRTMLTNAPASGDGQSTWTFWTQSRAGGRKEFVDPGAGTTAGPRRDS